MPKFNLAPLPDNLDPAWPPKPQGRPNAGQAKEIGNQRIEQGAASVPFIGGLLKPVAQFGNALASPDTKMGIFTGPVNGVSKLGNALGDLIQRKPIDTSDAWTISDQQARQINPWRLGTQGQYVTPSDQAGLEIGEAIGAELSGARVLKSIQGLARLKAAADALRRTQTVKNIAVASKASPGLRAGLNVGSNVGEALISTTLATPFLDQEDGNLANLGDAVGLNLPGRVEEGQNYLQAMGQSILVEGIATPLALLGLGSFIKPIRKGLASGDLGWIDELADAELEPYMPKPMAGPLLPPAQAADIVEDGSRSLPARTSADLSFLEAGPATYQWDSAIGRSLQEQTQIRQVTEQRQRLESMNLVQQGEGGQLEFNLGNVVDPEIRLQIRQLQTQRGQLIKQGMESGEDVTEQLGKIDQEIADLTQAGSGQDFMPGERYSQPELDMPDPRPELDTYLANLDELSDRDLRQIHSRAYQQDAAMRNQLELEATQAKAEELNQRLADIQARADAGEVTPVGAKRMAGKVQKELAVLEQQIQAIEGRSRVPESLVGDQLQLRIEQQGQLDLNPPAQMPPLEAVTRTASEYGYRTPDDYRNALQGWNRDQLRRLAMPDSSPEVAALVKARTGRRVWQAKKSDIIDALVEMSERRGRYLPPEAEQLAMELKANKFGDAAPLFDRPAELDVPGMGRVLDADGNEVVVPMDDYSGRGMDPQTREQLKADILRRAIDNGEVQPPMSPLPERPRTTFNQATLVDELFADPNGQLPLLYAQDQLPTYKAGGKGADALIEELRLRYEYNALDADAQRAQRDAYLAEQGWNTMTWEEKKKLGILSEGFYSLQPYSDQFRDPTPAARSDLDVAPVAPRKPKQYSLTFDEKGNAQVVEQPKAQAKPKPEEVKAQKKAEAQAKRATKNANNKRTAALDKEEASIKQRLEDMRRQSQGANC